MKLAKITASGPAKNVKNTQSVIYKKGILHSYRAEHGGSTMKG